MVRARAGESQETPTAEPKESKPLAKGTVLFEGHLPAVKELKVPERAAEGCCPPGEEVDREDRSLRISEDRGIAGVVATVTVKGEKVEIPDEAFEVDQKGCRFEPHVLVVPKGAKVAFLNSDETSHNVHLISVLNDPLNQTVLAGKKVEKEFDEPERIKVTCDMHSWMKSWVVVTEHPLGDHRRDGAFSFEGLPPGTHEGGVLARDTRHEEGRDRRRRRGRGRAHRSQNDEEEAETPPAAMNPVTDPGRLSTVVRLSIPISRFAMNHVSPLVSLARPAVFALVCAPFAGAMSTQGQVVTQEAEAEAEAEAQEQECTCTCAVCLEKHGAKATATAAKEVVLDSNRIVELNRMSSSS